MIQATAGRPSSIDQGNIDRLLHPTIRYTGILI
jgi:hypothetical protein